MKSFIDSIVTRHACTENHVMPRLKGRYEGASFTPVRTELMIDNDLSGSQQSNFNKSELEDRDCLQRSSNQSLSQNNEEDLPPIHPTITNHDELTPPLKKSSDSFEGKPGTYLTERKEEKSFMTANVAPGDNRLENESLSTTNIFRPSIITTLKVPVQEVYAEQLNIPSSRDNIQSLSNSLGQKEGQPPVNTIKAQDSNRLKLNAETTHHSDLSWVKDLKKMLQNQALEQSVNRPERKKVTVNIGRIDVRAVTQQAPVKLKADIKPAMSLDDFLKKKTAGS